MPAPTPIYQWLYQTPPEFDDLLLESDGHFLIGAHFTATATSSQLVTPPQSLVRAILWLDRYFAGHLPGPLPPYRLPGVTPFRQAVSDQLCQIPRGQTTTYSALACAIASRPHKAAARAISRPDTRPDLSRMSDPATHSCRLSPRAVGNAVGWNPLCVFIPCHRVVAAHGRLGGYSGGLANKLALLAHEGALSFNSETIPK